MAVRDKQGNQIPLSPHYTDSIQYTDSGRYEKGHTTSVKDAIHIPRLCSKRVLELYLPATYPSALGS